ncbi:MAG: grpE [Gammaproteobacteria bacterium]|jgi:molecular chaperone GrpE|nr:grpE [Gammaproteobacteria bacterium]
MSEQQSPNNKWKDLQENAGKAEDEASTADASLPPMENLSHEQVIQLQNELDQTKQLAQARQNDYLRAIADMENLRRRLERDVESAHKYALEKIVRELLPGIDSLEKSIEHANDDNLRQGVQMTLDLFLAALRKFHVSVVNPVGEIFNPAHAEAVSTVMSAEHPANTVIQVLQKGYLLHDRLVRPALVVVSKAG